MKYPDALARLRIMARGEQPDPSTLEDVTASVVLNRIELLEHVADAARGVRDLATPIAYGSAMHELDEALDALEHDPAARTHRAVAIYRRANTRSRPGPSVADPSEDVTG